MGIIDKIFGKKADAPATPPAQPAPASSIDKAKNDLSGRKSRLDQLEAEANGQKYKNGGLVKMTPKSKPYKCK